MPHAEDFAPSKQPRAPKRAPKVTVRARRGAGGTSMPVPRTPGIVQAPVPRLNPQKPHPNRPRIPHRIADMMQHPRSYTPRQKLGVFGMQNTEALNQYAGERNRELAQAARQTEIVHAAHRLATETNLTPRFIQHLKSRAQQDPEFQSDLNDEVHRQSALITARRNSDPVAIAGQVINQAVNPVEWAATGVQGVKDISHGDYLGGAADLVGVLPISRGPRALLEGLSAAHGAEEGVRIAEAAEAAGRSYKAGHGLGGPLLKLTGRGTKNVGQRVFRVGELAATQASADSRTGRAIENTLDRHREALSKLRLMNTEAEKTGRRAMAPIKARAEVGTAPGDALLKITHRPSWSRGKDYALRILAEHSLPGNPISIADRRAFHLTRAGEMKAEGDTLGAQYHRIHSRLIGKAAKFLTEDTESGAIHLAPDAPNDLKDAWRLLQQTSAGREDVYRDLGRLSDIQIANRIKAPGRVLLGARWLHDETIVRRTLDANPKRAELFQHIDQVAKSPEEAQAAKDIIDHTAIRDAQNAAVEGNYDPVPVVDELFNRLSGVSGEAPEGSDYWAQIDPFHEFPEEKVGKNLRAKLNPRTIASKSGLPLNRARTTREGLHFAGKITPEKWLKRVVATMPTAEERDYAARWYEHFEPLFRREFPPDVADKIIRAFAISQANASPSGGVGSTLAALERLDRGEEVGSIGSIVADNIEKALKGETIDSKVAAKLSDFIDALRGSETRTWMGHAEEGGKPAPIDIWSLRDQGYIDKKIAPKGRAERLLKMHGVDVRKLKIDNPGSATGARYERAAEKYHEIAEHLNATHFDGRDDWTPAQAQALGWASIQKFYGQEPEDLVRAITKGRVRAKGILKRGDLKQLVEKTKEGAGYTLHADLSPDTNSKGFVASYAHFEERIPQDELTVKHLTDFAKEHKDMLQSPRNRVGLWNEEGTVYLDVSRTFPTREEALAFAREHGQLAYADRPAIAGGAIERGEWDKAFPKTGLSAQEREHILSTARAKVGAPKEYDNLIKSMAQKIGVRPKGLVTAGDKQLVEDRLHEIAAANPDHPTSQQFTKLSNDAEEMRRLATPEPEDVFPDAEPKELKGKWEVPGIENPPYGRNTGGFGTDTGEKIEGPGGELYQQAHTGVWGEPEHQSWGNVKGAYTPEGMMHLVEGSADISTPLHEWMHHMVNSGVFRGHALDVLAKESGATWNKATKEWIFDTQAHEKAARMFEQYLRTGRGPEGMQKAMAVAAKSFREIYDHAELPDVSPPMARVLDQLITPKDFKGGRLLGAEDFASAVNYVPYTRGAPVALSREAQVFGAYIRHRLQLFNPGRASAIGRGPDDIVLKKSFTGALLRSGNFKADVARASVKALHTAWRLKAAKMTRDVLLEASKELPDDSTWLAIKVDPNENLPPEIKEYWDRIHSVGDEKMTADDLGDLDKADDGDVDSFVRELFPGEIHTGEVDKEGNPVATPIQELAGQLAQRSGEEMVGLKKPIQNIRWIPKELLEASGVTQIPAASKLSLRGLTKQQHVAASAVGLTFDAFNDLQRAGLLILSPSYIPVNLIGNVAMNVLHQGPLAFPNLIRAVLLHRELALEDRVAVDKLMGHGIMESVLSLKTGPGQLLNHTIGHWSGVLVDLAPRRAAFLHEARKAGYATPDRLRELLHDEANTEDLVRVKEKANEAIVDYDRLSPFEKNFVTRAIFVYPWIKGATHYSIRFAANHPVETMALAFMVDNAVDNANSELGPRPYYAQLEVPISTGSIGLAIPGTGLRVDASQAVGNHELTERGLPMTVSPQQLLTQTTPFSMAEDLAGTGGVSGFGSLASDVNPGIATLADWIAGHNPQTHQDVPQNLAGLWSLMKGNFAAGNKIKAVNDADPSNAKKLYPRDRKEAIEAMFLSGLAPKPFNTAKSEALAAGQPHAVTPEVEAQQWVQQTEKALGTKLPHEVIVARNTKAHYETLEKQYAAKTATGKLSENQHDGILLHVLIETHPEYQQYQDKLWQAISEDPSGARTWIEDHLGWNYLEKLDTAVNAEKKAKKLEHAHHG